MTRNKVIVVQSGTETFAIEINSTMGKADIAEAIHDQLPSDHDTQYTIHDPKYNQPATLVYEELKQGRPYLIVPTQGTSSGAAFKAAQNLAWTRQHWDLSPDADIFPSDLAPVVTNVDGYTVALEDPAQWTRPFTQKLRTLSSRSQGKHADAMECVRMVIDARISTGIKRGVTAPDLVIAARKWAEAEAQTEVDADGEGESKVGWEYEQGGKFNITTHFR